MNLRFLRVLGACSVLIGVCICNAALAQQPKRDPKVQAIMDQIIAAYKAVTGIHEKIVLTPVASSPDLINSWTGPEAVDLKLQKPNKIWLDYRGKTAGNPNRYMVVCDGVSLWRWRSATNTFTKAKAPTSFTELKFLPNDSPDMDMLFRNKDPFAEFKINDMELPVTLGAAMKVGDLDLDVLEARMQADGAPINATFRVRAGQKDHLIRGVVFEGNGKDPMSGKDVTFKFELTYDPVEASPAFTPADFAFTPPAGAKPEAPAPAKKPVAPTKPIKK